jgi:hypothetical protein
MLAGFLPFNPHTTCCTALKIQETAVKFWGEQFYNPELQKDHPYNNH